MKKLWIMAIIITATIFCTSCNAKFFEEPRYRNIDTVLYLGDGSIQIMKSWAIGDKHYWTLENLETDEIYDMVYIYKIEGDYIYNIGEEYTKLEYNKWNMQQSSDVGDFNDDDKKVFADLEKKKESFMKENNLATNVPGPETSPEND
jgi:hypothetical protein